MSRNHHDALIDQLLREILGNDRPRDITERVLQQAKIHDRFRRRTWVGAGAAIAACIAVAAALTVYWPRQYPAPQADGLWVSNGGEMRRGTPLETKDDPGSLKLGDYVDVEIAPQTKLSIAGTKYQEELLLDTGHLDVTVKKDKGKFAVAVGPASVRVTGTKFGVDVEDGLDETSTYRVKKLFVNVQEGSVDVQGVRNPRVLKAGDRDSFVISSEPVPASKLATPPSPATAPAVPNRVRPGIAAGMQEGARIGNRGLVRPFLEANAARGGLLAGQNRIQTTEVANMLRSVQIYSGNELFDRTGWLRQLGPYSVLETPQGTYLLFPTATPTVREFRPVTDRQIHVTWQGGSIQSIEPVAPATRPI
ncbi:MAG TPA: FecR domain-containing protein [Phycisphaerae bacterium]|nr:FecR domain-containing protein [Phycisphaerae bacterium]